MKQSLGFVGLGNMGEPMATRLVDAGHSVTVFDVRDGQVGVLKSKGAKAAGSPREVAERAETVLVSLPSPAIVRDVALGPDGLVGGPAMRTYIDLSTTGSTVAIAVAEELTARGLVAIDSPVSGGVAGAVGGTLAVMVSGPEDGFEDVKPLLDVIGKVFYVGDRPGLGQTMKLVNNLLSGTALAVTSEAMVMGVKAGLDPEIMLDVFNAGSGRNSATQDKFPRAVLPRTFDFGFTVGLLCKDLKLLMEEAEALEVPMWLGTAIRQMWVHALMQGGPEQDFTEICRYVEDWAGVKVEKQT